MILEKITKKNNRIMSFYEGKIPIINSVSHAFPCVFYLTHREMRNFRVFCISLCVLPKPTWKCASPCVRTKKPLREFGTHREIQVSSSGILN